MAELVVPSLAKASPQERRQLSRRTGRERRWYVDYSRFATNEAVMRAAHAGRLAFVDLDENFLPIGRLRNPEYFATLTPYLLPQSLKALKKIGQLWREELMAREINDPAIRLSVTSLTRSEARQAELRRDPTKLAAVASSHCVGAAFDLDASAYYRLGSEGPEPIMHPDRTPAAVKYIGEVLMNGISNQYIPPETDLAYDPVITNALIDVTDRLHAAGAINRIVEYGQINSQNRCIHIAPNPRVDFSALALQNDLLECVV